MYPDRPTTTCTAASESRILSRALHDDLTLYLCSFHERVFMLGDKINHLASIAFMLSNALKEPGHRGAGFGNRKSECARNDARRVANLESQYACRA